MENIKISPPLPLEVEQAINDQKLAIFIGAGVSRLIGCDGWDTLAKNLVTKCEEKNYIKPITAESLLKQADQLKLISICHNIFNQHNDKESFMDVMKKSLKDNEIDKLARDDNTFEIYKNLEGIGNTFITTNADRFIDTLFNGINIIKLADLKQNNISNGKIYKIHGCISEPDSLIFTKNRYMFTYANPSFTDFVKQFFSEYTVLFVGYGLNEFELLSKILPPSDENREPRHLFLNPYYQHEQELCNLESEYLLGLGIKLIPFSRDEKNYKQLIEVIDTWKKEIDKGTLKIQNSFKDIIEALENPS